MAASSLIRRHILTLPEGGTFTTRDVLCFGTRAAVDQALSRMVKARKIRRLARGVFAKDPSYSEEYSLFEIAKLKAQAFGRKITQHPWTIASELGMAQAVYNDEIEATFSVDSRTSKFRALNATIHLKQATSRKMQLDKSKAGQSMRVLWQIGRGSLTSSAIDASLKHFKPADREELRQNIRWLPAWLTATLNLTPRWMVVRPITG